MIRDVLHSIFSHRRRSSRMSLLFACFRALRPRMNSSETENWSRLDALVTRSCQVLRKVFKERWLRCTGCTWDDTPQSSAAFLQSPFGRSFRAQNKFQMQSIAEGDTNEWNILMLAAVLITWTIPTSSSSSSEYQFIEVDNQFIRSVRHVRNFFAHLPTKRIDDATFKQNQAILISSLVSLGDDPVELERLKSSPTVTQVTSSASTTK